MALATQCPHCLTTFRVAADQLKLRGGIVRCGACQSIFDGSAHLIDLDKPAAPPAVPAPAPAPDVPDTAAASAPPEDDALPVYTLDFTHTFEPLGILPNVATPAPASDTVPDAPAPRARVWRTGTSAQAPVAEPVPPAVPDETAPAAARAASSYEMSAEAPADAPRKTPATAQASPDAAPAAVPGDAAPDTVQAAYSGTSATEPVAAAPDAAQAAPFETPAAMPAAAAPDDAQSLPYTTSTAMPAETPPDAVQAARDDMPSAASYGAPPAADAYAPAGRIAPRLEPLVGAPPGAAVPSPGAEAEGAATVPDAEAEAPPVPHAAPAPASAYAPAGRIEPSFGLPVDEEIVARPLPDSEPEPEPAPAPAPSAQPEAEPAPLAALPPRPASGTDGDVPPAALPLRASAASESTQPAVAPTVPPARSKAARASEARARRSKLTPTKIEPPKLRIAADTDADEPEFVKRSRRQERTDRMRRLLMIAGAVVLLFALLAQVVLGWRNVLAQQHPGLKPVLAGACAVLGCRIELPALADNLVIETGELTTLGPNTYALNTLLRNQGSLVLAWPSIELELTDAGDKPVLRRVLAPSDYLPAGTSAANGFGPHSEQPVTLHFALAGLQPSGYHTFVFYP